MVFTHFLNRGNFIVCQVLCILSNRLAFSESSRAEPGCDSGLGFNDVTKNEPIENMYVLDKH